MEREKLRHIVVEGPVGVGKTSLARRLAQHFGATLMLENAGVNPFLPRFYEDSRRYALPTQLFFLFQRAEQAGELQQLDFFRQPVVADFMLEKDPLFARMNLADDEYALYQQTYQFLRLQVPAPDLVIYLHAPASVLIGRVQRRGIDYETPISESYLQRLCDSYARFFLHYTAAPVLMVNNEHLNCIDDAADFDRLLESIQGLQGSRAFLNRGD